MNKYVKRLSREWLEHNKIVIAVDYDSTIFPWHTIDNQEDMSKVIETLKKAYSLGAFIVLNTCSVPERYDEMKEYCSSIGLSIDGINTNPIDLPFGNHGKVYANIYIDDRAGLNEALDILNTTMYNIIGTKKAENLIDVG